VKDKGESISIDELVQAVAEDKSLLMDIVSKNRDIVESVVSESRHRRTIEERVTLNPTDFIVGFKDDLRNRLRDALHTTLYDFIVQDEERASTLRDPDTKAEVYSYFAKTFEVLSYVSCAENALSEVFEDMEKDIQKEFLVPKFGALDSGSKKRRSSRSGNTTPSEKGSPSKKGAPSSSSPDKVVKHGLLFSDEETIDENRPGALQPDEEEDLSATQDAGIDPEPASVSTPKSANRKKRLSQDSASSTAKKKRGRPKKGPDMDLYQGLRVELHDVIRNTWNEFTIAPKASDITITMTTARRALSAGNLRPVDSVVKTCVLKIMASFCLFIFWFFTFWVFYFLGFLLFGFFTFWFFLFFGF